MRASKGIAGNGCASRIWKEDYGVYSSGILMILYCQINFYSEDYLCVHVWNAKTGICFLMLVFSCFIMASTSYQLFAVKETTILFERSLNMSQTVINRKLSAIIIAKGYTLKLLMLLALLIVIFILSFILGRYAVPPDQLIKILAAGILPLEQSWSDTVETVIFQIRLPRILAAILVGAALSTAGAAYQGMFKNPLVSPDILGASAGAGFGAALGIYFSFSMLGIQIMAFLGGLLSVGLTYGISFKIRHDPMLALVLAGIMIGSLFTAAISSIKYIADPYDKLPAITFWLMGSLASIAPQDIYLATIPITIGILFLFLLRWRLNVMAMGEEEAQVLGLNTRQLKFIVIFCSTLITAASVSISGMVGWVGLVIPHLARMIVGPNYQVLLPASVLLGGGYLLMVDDLARLLGCMEIPLGILTALIGVPFFLYLLLNSKWGW